MTNILLEKNKFLKLLFVSAFLVSCQSLKTRDDVKKSIEHNHTVLNQNNSNTNANNTSSDSEKPPATSAENSPVGEQNPPAPVVEPVAIPKIGIILGAGGAKAYSHIGFLQELNRLRIPVYAIGGIEFGAPIAALYANKEFANDVEWQMFKIKDEELIKKSIFNASHKSMDVTSLNDFMKNVFAHLRVEDFKLPFACPANNIAKNQIFLMNRGSMDALLPYCWPYPPLFKPYKANVAAVRDIKVLADYLRSKGANYIIFVNPLGANSKKTGVEDIDSTENIVWTELQQQYTKVIAGVDTVISLNTEDYGIMDFEKRRELMQKGADSANKSLKILTKKWGL